MSDAEFDATSAEELYEQARLICEEAGIKL